MNEEKKKIILELIRTNPKGWYKKLSSKENLELVEEIKDEFPKNYSLRESAICLLSGLREKPKCKICGKEINSIDNRMFKKYCSAKCAQNDKDLRNNIKQTCIKKYGCDNPAKSEIVQKKMKQTCIDRYGAANIFASEIGKERIATSLMEKYGVKNPAFLKSVLDKRKQTLMEKYGVNCGFLTNKNYKTSKGEEELFSFIKGLRENSIHSDRKQIFPFELDVYIPDLKIGIEYDGDYWHSLADMIKRDEIKNRICEEKGIKLFRVKESEWEKNKETVKEKFRRILNG